MGPDPDVTQMLELSAREFKITMTNMSKALEEKMENHMENCKNIWRISPVRWEEIHGCARLKKQMLQEMKYTFDKALQCTSTGLRASKSRVTFIHIQV